MSPRSSQSVQERVGARIRALRKAKRLTQLELSGRADMSTTYLGQVERGERDVGLGMLDRIAKGLGVALHDLTDDPNEPGLTESMAALSPSGQRVLIAIARELEQYESELRARIPLAAEP